MGAGDRMDAGMDKAKGHAKEGYGKATDDEGKVVEGKLDQAKGEMKETTEDVKDAFDK